MSWLHSINPDEISSAVVNYLIHHNGVILALAVCYLFYGTAEFILLMLGKGGRLAKVCRVACHAIILSAIFSLAALHGLEYGHATAAQVEAE